MRITNREIDRLPMVSDLHSNDINMLNVVTYIKIYYDNHICYVVGKENTKYDIRLLCFIVNTTQPMLSEWKYLDLEDVNNYILQRRMLREEYFSPCYIIEDVEEFMA